MSVIEANYDNQCQKADFLKLMLAFFLRKMEIFCV